MKLSANKKVVFRQEHEISDSKICLYNTANSLIGD